MKKSRLNLQRNQVYMLSGILFFILLPILLTVGYSSISWLIQQNKSQDRDNTIFIKLTQEGRPLRDKAQYFEQMGREVYLSHDYDQAMDSHNKAIEYYTQVNKQDGLAVSYCDLAKIYRERGDFQKSLKYLKDAKSSMESVIDDLKNIQSQADQDLFDDYQLKLASIYYELGSTYRNAGNCKDSLKYHNKSYRIRSSNPRVQYTDLLMSQQAMKDLKIYLGIGG